MLSPELVIVFEFKGIELAAIFFDCEVDIVFMRSISILDFTHYIIAYFYSPRSLMGCCRFYNHWTLFLIRCLGGRHKSLSIFMSKRTLKCLVYKFLSKTMLNE